jgi:phosphate acetyltransferase
MQLPQYLDWYHDDALVVTPGDRGDIIVGCHLANDSINCPNIAGILLTVGHKPSPSIKRLIEGLPNPLPVLCTSDNTYNTIAKLSQISTSLKPNEHFKISKVLQIFDQNVDIALFEQEFSHLKSAGMTPKMFEYNLVKRAKSERKHIVLPEGDDERILKAASDIKQRDICDLTILGKKDEVLSLAKKVGVSLEGIPIVTPCDSEHRDRYAELFYEARKHKGVTMEQARDLMCDLSYYGTMMIQAGDADGMVSGAAHTTQHTIRPALQVIKTQPDSSIVSSVFFMCLPDRVVVYGDCAVNPNPTAEQLAEIAIQSAKTSISFGIDPKVAMLSYSSGDSGKGEEVEKVRTATQIVKQKWPDLKIEGPIQYDAAVDKGVGEKKLPGSPVAGKANVLIFPDLNTGNNTYKAVQRETKALAIGPVLQGLNKPVNDLSRGCLVADVINTIIITAIQS